MKKIYIAVACALAVVMAVAGCGRKSDNNKNKICKEGVVKCDWFEDKDVDAGYKIKDISFSKDDKTVVLSYATLSQKTPLKDYYVTYTATLEGDYYSGLSKVTFDSDYYAISAHITYEGDELLFTGLPAEQAETKEGFKNGCNLYIGDFKNNTVSNVRELDFGEDGKRYYILSMLEDGSIIYNSYDAGKDFFVTKFAKKNGKDDYTVKEITDKSIDGYYWKTIYANSGRAFIWRADQSDRSFTALAGGFNDGMLSDVAQLSPEFMNGKNYRKYYSGVGFDRSGGVYFYELSDNNIAALYRSQISGF